MLILKVYFGFIFEIIIKIIIIIIMYKVQAVF